MTRVERGAAAMAGGALGGLLAGGLVYVVGTQEAIAAACVLGFFFGASAGLSLAEKLLPPAPHFTEEMETAARQLGMKRKRRGTRFTGKIENGPVEITSGPEGVRVSFANLVRPLAIVRTPGLFAARPQGDDIVTGDPVFDAAVHVAGNDTMVRSLLDEATRARILEALAIAPELRIADGALTWGVPSRAEIVPAIRALAVAAARLRHADRKKLAAIVRQDPIAEVRIGALEALIHDPGEVADLADVVAKDALRDADPRVRVVAAEHLAELDVLTGIVLMRERRYLDGMERLDDAEQRALRRSAVLAIAGVQADERRVEAAISAILGGDQEVAALAAEIARPHNLLIVLPAIRALAPDALPDAREAIARALAGMPDPSNEDALLALLPSPFAIEALGEQGSVRAVEPLRKLRSADAEAAVQKIQARLEHGGAGQLAIADSEQDGRVSLAKQQQGQVSLKRDG